MAKPLNKSAPAQKTRGLPGFTPGVKVKKPKGGIVTPGVVNKKTKTKPAKSTKGSKVSTTSALRPTIQKLSPVTKRATNVGTVKAIAPVTAGGAGAAGALRGVGTGLDIFNTVTNLGQLISGGGGGQSSSTALASMGTMARDLLQAGGPIDISPGIPAGDIQVVDPDNIVINNATGKPAKLVPVGARIQRRRRVRRGGVSRAEMQRMLESQKNTDMMQMMMMMALAKGH